VNGVEGGEGPFYSPIRPCVGLLGRFEDVQLSQLRVTSNAALRRQLTLALFLAVAVLSASENGTGSTSIRVGMHHLHKWRYPK
jgi:hypothetical protein